MSRSSLFTALLLGIMSVITPAQKSDSTKVTYPPGFTVDSLSGPVPELISTSPAIPRDLYTVVLHSSTTEAEAKGNAKAWANKGLSIKIFDDPAFKKTKFKVTTGFFKKRLDAELLKRDLIKKYKNRKFWVRQVDNLMKELIFNPPVVKKNPAGYKPGNKDNYSISHLDDASLSGLLNTATSLIIYGIDGSEEGVSTLAKDNTPFIHVEFLGGNVTSASLQMVFPKGMAPYSRFFFSFNPVKNFNPAKAPVLITMPDRARLMKIKKFIDTDPSTNSEDKKKLTTALNSVSRQLVFNNLRIYLSKTDSKWYFCGFEEIK
ncbi:MAG: hypothetical protein J0L60_07035 [Ignavibacteria bacterium]|nr:hypothetical protein [Ignavibacteria bacterium]